MAHLTAEMYFLCFKIRTQWEKGLALAKGTFPEEVMSQVVFRMSHPKMCLCGMQILG